MFKNLVFFKWLSTYKTPLIITQVIAIVLSIVFSSPYFIPREYKSDAIVYPYNTTEYSHELPSEQLIEFLSSVDVKNALIAKFNLIKHYNIHQDGKPFLEKLYSKFDHNVNVKPTEFGAVELTVSDISPDTAYEMVNSMLEIVNKKILLIQQQKSMESVEIWKKMVNQKSHQVDSMRNLSKQLSTQYGLLDYGSQTREVSRAYYEALISGKGSKQLDEIQSQMKNIQEHGIELQEVNQHLEAAVSDYNNLELKYEDALKDATKSLTFWNLVSAPYKPDNYYYPIRTLIVLGMCLATFVFSVLFLMGMEKIKQ